MKPCAVKAQMNKSFDGIAGIQPQGCESSRLQLSSSKHLGNRHVTVHGTGFRHPCRNDEAPDQTENCCSATWQGEARAFAATGSIVLILSAWPSLAGADDIDAMLQRNMRLYSHAPASSAGQRIAPEPPGGVQAQMLIYDSQGRARSQQRVALGPMPAPQPPAYHPQDDFPRKPGPPKPAYEIDYTLTSGYREDRLNFNIAASSNPPYYDGNPNVLSELKWENIKVAQIGGKAEITSPGGWYFQGKVNYGFITAGKQQDSDYFGNDRTGEVSRSNNEANSGHTLDASIGAGYRFALRDNEGKVQLSATPLVGYSYSEQYLTGINYRQTIAEPSVFWCDPIYNPKCTPPRLGPQSGLDERYITQWHGPWLGLKATALPFDWMTLFGQFEYHWASYYAKANWNLRTDFQHPISFRHNASGDGPMISAGILFSLTPAWWLQLDGSYLAMTTDPGEDTTYFSDGDVGRTRLNRVQWTSWSANAGMRYRF